MRNILSSCALTPAGMLNAHHQWLAVFVEPIVMRFGCLHHPSFRFVSSISRWLPAKRPAHDVELLTNHRGKAPRL